MANPELLARIHSATLNPTLDLPTAIQRYLAGESIQVLAAEFGCDRSTLYRRMKAYMLAYDGHEYADLITQALVERIAHADQLLEESVDPVATSRAREMARFARMDLERRRPKLYGHKQQVDVDNRITVTVNKYIHKNKDLAPPSQVIEVALPSKEQYIDQIKDKEDE